MSFHVSPLERLAPQSRSAEAVRPLAETPASERSNRKIVAIAIGLAAVVGLVLRLAGTAGDLWCDEIWSLDLVSRIHHWHEVFWNISHDNNHLLNSLWLYGLGGGRSALAYRFPSVLFGLASIGVAGLIGLRINPFAGLAAAWLAAWSYPLVDYGSEARGYAGLVLAVLVAVWMARRLAHHPERRGDRLWLGIAISLGLCAHLTMAAAAVILAVSTAIEQALAGRTPKQALDITVDRYLPALLMTLPVIGCLMAGVLHRGEFTIGGIVPFTPARFAEGYGGMLRVMLGFSDAPSSLVVPLLAGAALAAAVLLGLLGRHSSVLALVALVIVPAALFAARIGNTLLPRYFLVCGVIVLLLLAEALGRLWQRGGVARWLALALLAANGAAQASPIQRLLTDHRGSYAAAVAEMGAKGPAVFDSDDPGLVFGTVAYFADMTGLRLSPVDPVAPCALRPGWFIRNADAGDRPPETVQDGPAQCRTSFVRSRVFPTAPWSGRQWTLFRAVDPG